MPTNFSKRLAQWACFLPSSTHLPHLHHRHHDYQVKAWMMMSMTGTMKAPTILESHKVSGFDVISEVLIISSNIIIHFPHPNHQQQHYHDNQDDEKETRRLPPNNEVALKSRRHQMYSCQKYSQDILVNHMTPSTLRNKISTLGNYHKHEDRTSLSSRLGCSPAITCCRCTGSCHSRP